MLAKGQHARRPKAEDARPTGPRSTPQGCVGKGHRPAQQPTGLRRQGRQAAQGSSCCP